MMMRPTYAAMSQHASYEHERLKLSERSIRLFQVQKGSDKEPISLRMTQFSAARRPQYKAVSYMWGSPLNPKQILVNGKAFSLHVNLWSLLFHLRQKGETAFLWADALCINQANLKERNFHVQLMGRIYEKAETVIVWLGPSTPDPTVKHAFAFLGEIATFRSKYPDTAFAKAFLKADLEPRWQVLLNMCKHDYWFRTWVTQEFLLSPSVEVMSGLSCLDWREFEQLIDLLRKDAIYLNHPVIPQLLRTRTARLTLHRRTFQQTSLHSLLTEYNDSACTERKDKVYGILGLTTDCAEDPQTGESKGVSADYNKHVFEVYLDTVSCIKSSLTSSTMIPSVAHLVLQALLITREDITDYQSHCASPRLSMLLPKSFEVLPQYVSPVRKVWSSWSGPRDIQQQLETYDWGEHLGYEIVRVRTPTGRRGSARPVHPALPEDFLSNAVAAVNLSETLPKLHNYSVVNGFVIPSEHISMHSEDKRMYDNPGFLRPSLILEETPNNESVRLGFACTNVRQGDLVVQFRGLDTAYIARRFGHRIELVGRAMMLKHSGLSHEDFLDPICDPSPWVSHSLCRHNPDQISIDTDPLSLAELFTWD